MANTRMLTTAVEEYVRTALDAEHRVPFTEQRLALVGGGLHEFDAVSTDGRIIAPIKSASGAPLAAGSPRAR